MQILFNLQGNSAGVEYGLSILILTFTLSKFFIYFLLLDSHIGDEIGARWQENPTSFKRLSNTSIIISDASERVLEIS